MKEYISDLVQANNICLTEYISGTLKKMRKHLHKSVAKISDVRSLSYLILSSVQEPFVLCTVTDRIDSSTCQLKVYDKFVHDTEGLYDCCLYQIAHIGDLRSDLTNGPFFHLINSSYYVYASKKQTALII